MGDRSNVYFPEEYGKDRLDRGIYLYSHWGGADLFEYVQYALDTPAARDRWSDSAYLTRIVVQHVLAHHAPLNDPTGWGLSAGLTDNSYPILVVDSATQRVYFMPQGKETTEPSPTAQFMWTFEQFVTLAKVPLEKGP